MTGPALGTSRLTLTPVAVTDYADLFALWNQEVFHRHITGRPLSEEEVWFRLLRDIGHWTVLDRGNWTMRLTDTGAYVGQVGVLDFRRAVQPALDAPEVGWGVDPAFQGQGLAREGLEAALVWADGVLKAPRTVCMIGPGNLSSLRLAGRAGFVRYADGVYHGEPTILLERMRPPGSSSATAR